MTIDSCQNKKPADQCYMTIARAQMSSVRVFTRRQSPARWRAKRLLPIQKNTGQLGSTCRMHAPYMGDLFNGHWRLSKQGVRWPASHDRIAGSTVELTDITRLFKIYRCPLYKSSSVIRNVFINETSYKNRIRICALWEENLFTQRLEHIFTLGKFRLTLSMIFFNYNTPFKISLIEIFSYFWVMKARLLLTETMNENTTFLSILAIISSHTCFF